MSFDPKELRDPDGKWSLGSVMKVITAPGIREGQSGVVTGYHPGGLHSLKMDDGSTLSVPGSSLRPVQSHEGNIAMAKLSAAKKESAFRNLAETPGFHKDIMSSSLPEPVKIALAGYSARIASGRESFDPETGRPNIYDIKQAQDFWLRHLYRGVMLH